MLPSLRSPSEEFSAGRLIERTWEEFNRRILSQGAVYVLWGGFESVNDLVDRYFSAKNQKHLLDKRRRLTEEDVERVEGVRALAQQALDYRNWARNESGDPILRDILVAYCAAFENALKSVALTFRVASTHEGNVGAVLVPNGTLAQFRREVRSAWDKATKLAYGAGSCTAEYFYVEEVRCQG